MDFSLLSKIIGIPNSQLVRALGQFANCQHFLESDLAEIEPFLSPKSLAAIKAWRQSGQLSPLYLERYQQAANLLSETNVQTLTLGDDQYPPLLAEIPDPPAVLFIRGDTDCLRMPQIAVVGSRKSTAQGIHIAGDFTEQLGRAGFAITSGLALGIDAAAHIGALNAKAKTVAVMGTGVEQIYPARHKLLAGQILASGGALVSEFLPGSPPRPHHFPQRNRIVTGLSLGVLVVEAGERSGSLISARLAVEQGREVCVVPGSILSPVSTGCNQLIREGATLVVRPEQMVEQLGSMFGFQMDKEANHQSESSNDKDEKNWLLDLIGFDILNVDQICNQSGRSVAEITSELMKLEIAGKVVFTDYGYQRQK